jgi:tetratricopeptide (TPR) repeat protein
MDVENVSQLWGESYDRNTRTDLDVQDDIKKKVAGKLRLRLTAQEQQTLSRQYTASSEANRLYLMGRYHWNKRTWAGFEKGIACFEQAIEKDPGYALAYTGLANCYSGLAGYMKFPTTETFPRAKAAATRALELDPTLAEAYASLGYVAYGYDWDWEASEKAFKKAIELNPKDATSHHWYAEYLALVRRFDEAIAEKEKALELDPLSPIIRTCYAYPYLLSHRFDEAIDILRKAIDLEPNFWFSYHWLGHAYFAKHKYEDAIQAFHFLIWGKHLRQAEVEHLHSSVRCDFDICGFDIPMDGVPFMRRFKSLRYLKGQLQGFFDRNGTRLDPIGQCLSLNQFKHQEVYSTGFFQPMDRRDIGVVQGCQQLGFTMKSCNTVGVSGELFGQ